MRYTHVVRQHRADAGTFSLVLARQGTLGISPRITSHAHDTADDGIGAATAGRGAAFVRRAPAFMRGPLPYWAKARGKGPVLMLDPQITLAVLANRVFGSMGVVTDSRAEAGRPKKMSSRQLAS